MQMRGGGQLFAALPASQARPPRRRLGGHTALGSHQWRNRPNRRIEEGVAASPLVLSTSSPSLFSLRVPWLCLKRQVGLVHKPFFFQMFPDEPHNQCALLVTTCLAVCRKLLKVHLLKQYGYFVARILHFTAFCRTLP